MVDSSIAIRPASLADLAAVTAIVHDAYSPHIVRVGRRPEPMDADHAAAIEAGSTWVATSDGRPVGVLVTKNEGSSLVLQNVAVAPGSQHRGIGRQLIAFAEQHAVDLDLVEITLYTNAKMTENIGLYTALGYVETSRRRDRGFDRVFFRKKLK